MHYHTDPVSLGRFFRSRALFLLSPSLFIDFHYTSISVSVQWKNRKKLLFPVCTSGLWVGGGRSFEWIYDCRLLSLCMAYKWGASLCLNTLHARLCEAGKQMFKFQLSPVIKINIGLELLSRTHAYCPDWHFCRQSICAESCAKFEPRTSIIKIHLPIMIRCQVSSPIKIN